MIGSASHVQYLVRWLRTDGAEPPLLLSHPQAELLEQITEELCLLAVCEQKAHEPCRACQGCRSVLAGHGGSVRLPADTATLTIKDLRTALKDLNLTTIHTRLVIIPRAERLSLPAANALLKTLEEVAQTTRFLLTTRFPRRLVPTLRSRCHYMALRTETPDRQPTVRQSSLLSEDNMLRRLSFLQTADKITDEELTALGAGLGRLLRERGPSAELTRAYLRLRDYYRIRGQRGNERLAKEVLVASLPTSVR